MGDVVSSHLDESRREMITGRRGVSQLRDQGCFLHNKFPFIKFELKQHLITVYMITLLTFFPEASIC